jgi:hypothetical protein
MIGCPLVLGMEALGDRPDPDILRFCGVGTVGCVASSLLAWALWRRLRDRFHERIERGDT